MRNLTARRGEHKALKDLVSPVDRMARATSAYLVLVISFTLNFTIIDLFLMMVSAIYLFFTALSGWDPFYALFMKLRQSYKDNSAMKGRF